IRNGSTNFTAVNKSSGGGSSFFWYNFTPRADGNYTFFGWLNDSAGNVVQTLNRTIVVDTVGPAIALIANTPANQSVLSSSFIFINTSENDGANNHNDFSAFIDFNNSLVGYWRFEDDGDPNASNASDFTSNNNNGSLVGFGCTTLNCNLTGGLAGTGSGWTSGGRRGKALIFDGVDDYVEVADSASLNITTDQLTVAAWVRVNATKDIELTQFIVSRSNGTFTNGSDEAFSLSIANGGTNSTGYADEFSFAVSNGTVNGGTGLGGTGSSAVGLNLNDSSITGWNYFVGTYNGSVKRMYKNGVPFPGDVAMVGRINALSGPAKLRIGQHGGVSGRSFDGSVDEVMIWSRALSPDEIDASYQAGV
ncbi:MAG: LamG domain-containing protein, partial [Nanoarchaeota archaeon]